MWETTTNQHTKGNTMTLSHPAWDEGMAQHTVTALRLYKRHPELGFPSASWDHVNYFVETKEELAKVRRTLALGKWTKKFTETYYTLIGQTAEGETVEINIHREKACDRVVTGKETVTHKVLDPDALAHVPMVEVTEEVDVVEWRCIPA